MKIYNIILRGIEQIEFPRHVTKTAITIIRKFCRENPTERLGYQKDGINDVKKHRYEIHNFMVPDSERPMNRHWNRPNLEVRQSSAEPPNLQVWSAEPWPNQFTK